MADTIDKLLQINDEPNDETRGLQTGEEAVDADGRFNVMQVRDTVPPDANDDTHKTGTLWIDTAAKKHYVCVDNTASNAVWVETKGNEIAPVGPLPIMTLNHSGSDNLNASASDNVVPWDTEVVKDSSYTHSTVTNNSRVAVTKSGTYIITLGITTVMNPVSNARYQGSARLRANGTTNITDRNISTYARGAGGSNYSEVTTSWIVKLSAGDYFEVLIDRESNRSTAMDMVPNEQSLSIAELSAGLSTASGPAGRIVVVDPAGDGDATTIEDGITAASALTPTAADPVAIQVVPGTYTESNPLMVPANVSVVAVGGLGAVIVKPTTVTAAIFELGNGSSIVDMIAQGADGTGGVGFRISGGNQNGVLYGCSARDCETGMLSTGSGTILGLENPLLFRSPGATLTYGVRAEAGGVINASAVIVIGIPSVAPITQALSAVGTDSLITCLSSSVEGATSGLYANDAGTIQMDGARFTSCGDALHVGPTGAGRILCGTTDVVDSVDNDTRIESATGTIDFIGVFDPRKRTVAAGSQLGAIGIDHVRNRGFIAGGVNIEGGADIGTPGAEFNFVEVGEGGPYRYDQFGVEIVEFWTYDASAASGSRFNRLADNAGTLLAAAGDALIVGSRFKFAAARFVVDTAATIGAGTFAVDYWDGSTWVSAGFTVYGVESSKRVYDDWVADDNVLDAIPDWEDGEDHYALRIRNVTARTSGGVISDGGVRGNDLSIHSDGHIIFWGSGRTSTHLTLLPGLLLEPDSNSPRDEDMDFSANIEIAGVRNEFASTQLDQVHYQMRVPDNVDTATPARVRITGYLAGGSTGDVELAIRITPFADGQLIDGGLTEFGPFGVTEDGPGTSEEAFTHTIDLLLPGLAPGSNVALSLERDARGSNGNDTNGDNYIMLLVDVEFSIKRLA